MQESRQRSAAARGPISAAGVLATAVWLAGCAPLSLGRLEGTRTVGVPGGGLEVSVQGEGVPAVVFESGAGAGCELNVWAKVIAGLGDETTLFAYNRSGYGRSHVRRDLDSPHQVVESLRRALAATGVGPPYVLVGHSLGGLYMNLFARLHPDEVAGVVLLDSSHPGQFETMRKEKALRYAMLVSGYSTGPPRRRYELANMKRFHRAIEGAGPFPDVPLVVLTAGESPFWQSDSERDWWLGLQRDLAAMSPSGRGRIVEASGHFIHRDQPSVVVEAIGEILAANRE